MLLAVALVCMLAAVATFSKGTILLGLPVGIALVLLGGAWRGRERWPLWLLLGLIAVAAAGLLILFQTPRFADLFNFQAGTTFFRRQALAAAPGIWRSIIPCLALAPTTSCMPTGRATSCRPHGRNST